MTVMDVKSSFGKGSRISHHFMGIMDLPWVITIEILSRLSIKPIFRCRVVCKLWYSLLTSEPLFFNMHQTRSLNFPNILLLDGQCNPLLLELKAEYDYYVHRCNRPIQVTPKFHFHPWSVIFVGSCNGFICLVSGLTHIDNHSVYISNPLLGEYFKLELPKWEISVSQVAYGFCFSEVSGEYKVLRLVDRKVQEILEHQNWRFILLEFMRNGEMWVKFPVLYGMILARLMSTVLFIGWIAKKITAFTPSMLRQKRSSPCQLHLV
ncbi:hypothetical protein H5410_052455 [Solanum commersonii]|uniref:F-box domain-containing protein n=1 Tax=Solanum commersonii TaxID=4109 RepID=A0A9J5X3F8_SOLCO|nr:hypothetical protein H5410_052455 [Solanum commersonii]